MRFRACGREPAETALRPFGPAWYPTHRKGSLRSAARAAAPSLAAGRGHGLAPFAFRLAAPAGAGSAYPLGAPPLKRGTPLSQSLDGPDRRTLCARLETRVPRFARGCGVSPPMADRALGRPIPRGRGIRPRLPPAPRRGLVVCRLDADTPTPWAPMRSSAALRPAMASA